MKTPKKKTLKLTARQQLLVLLMQIEGCVDRADSMAKNSHQKRAHRARMLVTIDKLVTAHRKHFKYTTAELLAACVHMSAFPPEIKPE